MHVLGERFYEVLLIGRKSSSFKQIFLQASDFGFSRIFSSEQKPKDTFRDRLTTWYSGWSLFNYIEKLVSTVANTLVWIQFRSLIEHSGKASHATKDLSNLNFADDCVRVLLSELHRFLLSCCNYRFHFLLEDLRREFSTSG